MQNSDNETKVNKNKIDTHSELITIFIGASIFILGFVNSIKAVPDAFIIGATLAGLFFTLSDFNSLRKNSNPYINGGLLFLGVFSFFLLPVILMVFPNLSLDGFSDFATFLALAAVVVSLGLKSYQSKRSYLTSIYTELNSLYEQRNQDLEKFKRLQEEAQQRNAEVGKLNTQLLELFEKFKELDKTLQKQDK
jgi:hypothetical protein